MQINFVKTILKTSLISLLLCVSAYALPSSTGEPETSTASTTATATTPDVDTSASASAFFCEHQRDCDFHGSCDTETGICHCDSGYTEEDCSYKQKSQLVAFLLHFFLGLEFGSGNFYAGDDAKGGGEIGLFWGSVVLAGCGAAAEDSGSIMVGLGGLGILGSFVWWIVEAVRFGENDNKDGNGKPLEEW